MNQRQGELSPGSHRRPCLPQRVLPAALAWLCLPTAATAIVRGQAPPQPAKTILP